LGYCQEESVQNREGLPDNNDKENVSGLNQDIENQDKNSQSNNQEGSGKENKTITEKTD
jgi:hypothetical protein